MMGSGLKLSTGADSWGGLQEILLADDGPANQFSQDDDGIEFQNHLHVQYQHPMRPKELEILDENLLHLPYGYLTQRTRTNFIAC
jgi:hypothetical protein